MSNLIPVEEAVAILYKDAERIKNLVSNQQNHQCIAQCKAFEEVIDTQMYGFSKQVEFAVKIGIITQAEGHQLMVDLEKELNEVYSDIYNEVYDEQKG
ncbi:DUF1507 family protein [Vagococcus acidifermentans]|uniref:Uncharacterized protein n=1 Tax=Vagococcus acidifermentans TaxID=564710 RepID=A0A430B0A8_9ENTE|nr:DUF1507 family protein [Vagococcus acidifermentans]RSU13739.1 hypothetical protein CBF27_02230 [Vagococcus acidifermentans]